MSRSSQDADALAPLVYDELRKIAAAYMGGPQLGELEAGAVANWLGAPFSVISGGIGCLVCTTWVAVATPALRHYRRETSDATAVVP